MALIILVIIAIVHEPLLEVSAESATCVCRIAPSFKRFPPRRIHIHPDHDFPLLVKYANVIVLCVGLPPPRRWQEEAHDSIGYTISQ
jgi:hypothetical protein